MKYIIAVSGGVDSVVLLDMMSRLPQHELVVAHFDHGIRSDSAEDAQFVKNLAQSYRLPFEMRREELGEGASEALARNRRYAFLRELAKRYEAKIVTAHHNDDLVETVAINLLRGTGWRGLAVLDSDITRPLLEMSKADLLHYANRKSLSWREDSTNSSDAYLRNRIRPLVAELSPEAKRQINALRQHQRKLKRTIEAEILAIVGEGPLYSRYVLTHIPRAVAEECLRVLTAGKLTRPQCERALLAVKTAKAGGSYEAGSGVVIHFTTRYFTLSLIK